MRSYSCLLLLGLLLLSAPAAAGKEKPSPLPANTGKAIARPVFETDGRFSFCLADHSYADGRKLSIALSSQDQINLGFTMPGGRFEIGGRYDLTLALSGEDGRKIRAQAIDPNTVLLQMGVNPKFRKKFVKSSTVSLSSPSRTVVFDLPPMPAILSALQTCISDNKGKIDPTAAKVESALPETLKALLITAGFTNIVPMNMEAVPEQERPADYAWQTGKVLGGIRERKAPQGQTLSDLIGLYMGGLRNQCPHAFKANIEREQKAGALSLRIAQAVCGAPHGKNKATKAPQAQEITVALLFYLTPQGGFTVFTHEGEGAAKTEALAARDRLTDAIKTLALREAAKAQTATSP